MKKILIAIAALLMIVSPAYAKIKNKTTGRPQWTETQAWEWEQKVGIIKGFNQPERPYPGMSQEEIIAKAASLGLNSVRFWVGGATVEEQIANIERFALWADKYGMTISPVLSIQRTPQFFGNPDEKQGLKDAEKALKAIVTPFKDDDRIILWDLWNEPEFGNRENTLREMYWIEQMVLWFREVGLSQPITSSIVWDTGGAADTDSELGRRRNEVEAMMDIHNFHDYNCAEQFGGDVDVTVERLRKISDRPLVCTECLTRINDSGVQRTLSKFARHHVHFYVWGLFNSEANWTVGWGHSAYDPYENIFHNLVWADGEPIDHREIDWIRNYKFIDSNDTIDPGLEYTEVWPRNRAWARMATGPVKGKVCSLDEAANPGKGYNSARVKLNYSDFASDKEAFFAKVKDVLDKAAEGGNTITLTLLDDNDAVCDAEALGKYVHEVIDKFYTHKGVQAWDLWHLPGEICNDTQKLTELVTTAFRYARLAWPNQPVTATPLVSVKFEPGFDYHAALIHGRRNGWNKFEYPGGSSADLIYKIWCMSDVVSFASTQPQAEAGWVLSVCTRFGRPVFCTDLASPSAEEAAKTLERFGMSHIYWYSSNEVPEISLHNFRFIPISTNH
ncbi:MAG: cellulase family glycosylhydrolase [Bacteroidales bacterium]|nr:cellulase family glycosylhydrolase [Bacteroidales bacterium]